MTLALILAAVAVLVLARETVAQWRLRRYRRDVSAREIELMQRREADR